MVVQGFLANGFEIHGAKRLDLVFKNQARFFNLVLKPVQVLGIRERLGRCVFVIRLEGLEDFFRRVAKVQDERVFLACAGAVQSRQRLHRLQAGQFFIDIHRVQQRLVKPCLVLFGHQQHLVLVAVKLFGQLFFLDAAIHADFRPAFAKRLGVVHRA